MNVCMYTLYGCVNVCNYTYMCVCIRVYGSMYVRVYVFGTYVHTYIYMHVYMYVCMYLCMHTCHDAGGRAD